MSGIITGIGANVFDTLMIMPEYPKEDTKIYADRVLKSGGGPCATGLVAAARLGAKSSWIGVLTDDEGGRFLYDDFIKYGVSVDNIDRIPGRESFSSLVLLNSATGSRTCLLNRGNLPSVQLDAAKIRAIEEADILMIDGNYLDAAVEGAKIARRSGTKVLYDAGGLYKGVEQLLELTDYLIPSEHFGLTFTGKNEVQEAAQDLFERFHPEMVAITTGSTGGVLYDGKSTSRWPVFKVDAIDSNGAGDVFHGAFAYAMIQNWDYRTATLFASAVSAIKCTKPGARAGVPSLQQTITFLKEQGYDGIH
ncbi:MAG: PfkB family carbohydrate kinase [Planctomycetia bacterium]|nr:PfkB family carbohydrate kinase [Planctomycetia bacterium]